MRYTLRLQADPNVAFYQISGTRRSRLCSGSCEIELPPGVYPLALGLGDQEPVETKLISVRGPMAVDGTYRSRAVQRAAFGVLGALGLSTGLGFAIRGVQLSGKIDDGCGEAAGCDQSPGTVRLAWGIVSALAGGVFTVLALIRPDRATMHTRPLPRPKAETTRKRAAVGRSAPPRWRTTPRASSEAARKRGQKGLAKVREAVTRCLTEDVPSVQLHIDGLGRVTRVEAGDSENVRQCAFNAARDATFGRGQPRVVSVDRVPLADTGSGEGSVSPDQPAQPLRNETGRDK